MKAKRMLTIGFILIWYLLFPAVMKDTGSAMFMLLVLTPAIMFCCGAIHGWAAGFDWLVLLAVFGLFIVDILLFMNRQWDCLNYAAIYFLLAMAGMGIGTYMHRKIG